MLIFNWVYLIYYLLLPTGFVVTYPFRKEKGWSRVYRRVEIPGISSLSEAWKVYTLIAVNYSFRKEIPSPHQLRRLIKIGTRSRKIKSAPEAEKKGTKEGVVTRVILVKVFGKKEKLHMTIACHVNKLAVLCLNSNYSILKIR